MIGMLLDNDFDLVIMPKRDSTGKITQGLVTGTTDYQVSHCVTVAQKGEFKEYPTLGFGIQSYLKGTVIQAGQKFKTELQKELRTDGIIAIVRVFNNNTEFTINIK